MELPLHELLALSIHDSLSIVLVVDQLLIQHPNEGVLICSDIFSHLLLSIAQLLHNRLHDLLVEAVLYSALRGASPAGKGLPALGLAVVVGRLGAFGLARRLDLLLVGLGLLLGMLLMAAEELRCVREQLLAMLEPVVAIARRCLPMVEGLGRGGGAVWHVGSVGVRLG